MDDNDRFQQLYPELADGTTVQALFNAVLLQIGSSLVDAQSRKFMGRSYTRFAVRPRSSQIYIAAEKRLFLPDYWDHGVQLASGESPDPFAVARSVDQWISGRATSIRDLTPGHPFVTPSEDALEHEDGTRTEKTWRRYLEGSHLSSIHPDLPLLAAVAARNPKLGSLFPYVSMGTFCLSRCTGYPFTKATPSFCPLGKQRFRVSGPDGPLLGEGSAEEVVELAAAVIPDDWGPARKGTAEDET